MGTKYTQFTGTDREQLYILKKAGLAVKEIADRLGRHKSSVYREISRNTNRKLGYLPDRAQNMARKRKNRLELKLTRYAKLKAYVVAKLKEGWSPSMISGRAKHEALPVVASHECIYQFIYNAEGKKLGLHKCLRMARSKRGKMRGRKPRGVILNRISIHDRPAEIEDRQEFGHYEGDLVINQKSMSRNVSVILERKSRYVRIQKNETKHSSGVMLGIFNILAPLPPDARKSVTFDNGKEFAKHCLLRTIKIKTFFCDAYSSWQKGGVENVNKMIRWFLPKNISLKDVTDEQLQTIENRINSLPRKCLGFRTASEVFRAELVALQS
jgi:Transposase and inactivated derivatives, IS30 family